MVSHVLSCPDHTFPSPPPPSPPLCSCQVSKLLLSLDPEDPTGVLLQMDYLAIRAGDIPFLIRFAREFMTSTSSSHGNGEDSMGEGEEGGGALALLPNYAYGCALATLMQEADSKQKQQAAGAGGAGGGGGAHQGRGSSSGKSSSAAALKEEEEGDAHHTTSTTSNDEGSSSLPGSVLLTQAVLLHPWVIPPLVGKLREQGAAKDSRWSALLGRKLFTQVRETTGGSDMRE